MNEKTAIAWTLPRQPCQTIDRVHELRVRASTGLVASARAPCGSGSRPDALKEDQEEQVAARDRGPIRHLPLAADSGQHGQDTATQEGEDQDDREGTGAEDGADASEQERVSGTEPEESA